VYLAMTRGQETLVIDMYAPPLPVGGLALDGAAMRAGRYVVHRMVPDAAELALHRAYLDALARECKSGCVWLALDAPPPVAIALA
jgi:hypothetical protein